MKCIIAQNQKHFYDQVIVRSEVFVIEQKVPIDEEIDNLDAIALQFIVYDEEKPVGAARFRIVDGLGKIERVCVLKSYRKKGVGKLIMNTIEDYARKQRIHQMILNAQLTAIPFYKQFGYTDHGEIFLDANIEHKAMHKAL
ncbi:GNAT family N-acetyltransferase [Mycoplasmatota bacterium]|nr:GNAT family N-acetyltransferase [Mycoplasmatota bacterium]